MAKLKFNPVGYQDLGAYALLKNIVENGHLIAEDSNSLLFPIYEAVISQTGTDAPSLNFLFKDDLGDITFTRQDEGMYKIESAGGKFSSAEKSSLQWSFYDSSFRTHITTSFEKDDDYAYLIRTYDSSGVLTDGQMTPITIKITVYP